MANYIKSTDFAAKDALASGNANKVVRGSEINDEFSNIQTAVNSKADLLSPALVGIPTAPTADFGTTSTQVATTAFVQAALSALYPIGTIYTSTSATNPAVTFGFGTWEAFGAGRVLVGQDTSDSSFNTLGETGGSKNAIVVSHSHTGSTGLAGSHSHALEMYTSGDDNPWGGDEYISTSKYTVSGPYLNPLRLGMRSAGNHTHSFSTDTIGSSGTNANLQPYVVVKMWKRTA